MKSDGRIVSTETPHEGRDVILGRIRSALHDGAAETSGHGHAHEDIPRNYTPASPDVGTSEIVDLFASRIEGTHATVHRTHAAGVADVVAAIARERKLQCVIAPAGINPSWTADSIEWVTDDPPLTVDQIEATDGVLTTATVATADSGTFVLDSGPGQGRRILSLLPDAMIVVLDSQRIVADFPATIARADPRRALTFVSGPSATVDIELSRVDGVHGPRELDVVIVESS